MKLGQIGIIGSGHTVPPFVPTPVTWAQQTFGSNLVFSLDASYRGIMEKESAVNPGLTIPTADGDPIGFVQDMSPNAHIMFASADVGRPTLGSDGTVNSFLICNGTSNAFVIENSKSCFQNSIGPSPVMCVMLRMKMGASTNGSDRMIINSSDYPNVTTRKGIAFYRHNSNTMAWVSRGSSGTLASFGTAFTITEADGWVDILLKCNGAGTNKISIRKNSGSDETFNLAAGTLEDSSDLVNLFKCSNSNTNFFKGNIAQVHIVNRLVTDAEWTSFRSYNPVVDYVTKPTVKQTHYSYAIPASRWQNTAETIPATAQNDPIGRLKNLVVTNFGGTLGREADAPTNGKRPLVNLAYMNGKDTGFYDGETSQQELDFFAWYNGGSWTMFLITQNIRTDEGTKQMVSPTNQYLTYTCFADASNPAGPCHAAFKPYAIDHTTNGQFCLLNVHDQMNVTVWRVTGNTLSMFDGAGNKVDATITGKQNFQKMGGLAGTWTNSQYAEIQRYTYMTDADVLAAIRYINNYWGMAGI
jgi:hypothetical protein